MPGKKITTPLSRGVRFAAACNLLRLSAREPFALAPFWETVTRDIFGTVDSHGLRTYKRATITMGKKGGKTTTLAAWAAVLLTLDGDADQSIVTISGSLDQASNIYKQLKKFLLRSRFPEGTFRCNDQYRRITVMLGPTAGAEFRSLAAKAETQHGVIPTIVLVDEAVFVDQDLWTAVEESLAAAREPLTISISHADRYDPASTYQKQLATARQIRDGQMVIPWWYVAICELDPRDNWRDETTWMKANPTLGGIKSLDAMRRSFEEACRIPSKMTRWRQWHLNQFTEAAGAWIAPALWGACAQPVGPEELVGQPVYVGLDLASTADLSSLAAVWPRPNGTVHVRVVSFLPEEACRQRAAHGLPIDEWVAHGWLIRTPGARCDYEYIRKTINEWAARYDIRMIVADKWNATHLIQQLTDTDGLPVVIMGQGIGAMSGPSKELERRVADGTLTHDDSPVTAWCVGNCIVESDAYGNIRPSKSKSAEKIDAVVALVMALEGASRGGTSAVETNPYDSVESVRIYA